MYGLTIVEFHQLMKENKINIQEYYNQLFEDAKKQQKSLNAFVTITQDQVNQQLKNFQFDENNLLSGVAFVAKDNYSTKLLCQH